MRQALSRFADNRVVRFALLERRAGQLRSNERGFTLIEMLLVTSLLAVILVALLALLDVSTRMAPRDQERGNVLRDAQVGLHRMTRELRQAYALQAAQSTRMQADVLTNAGSERVTYDCNVVHPQDTRLRRCVRFGADGRQEVVIDRMASAAFTYEGTPTNFARIRVTLPARGSLEEGLKHNIELDDGFYMRNRDVAP